MILTDRIPDNDNSPLVYYRVVELGMKDESKINSRVLLIYF